MAPWNEAVAAEGGENLNGIWMRFSHSGKLVAGSVGGAGCRPWSLSNLIMAIFSDPHPRNSGPSLCEVLTSVSPGAEGKERARERWSSRESGSVEEAQGAPFWCGAGRSCHSHKISNYSCHVHLCPVSSTVLAQRLG
jgi:hypothetical protein